MYFGGIRDLPSSGPFAGHGYCSQLLDPLALKKRIPMLCDRF